MTTPTPPCSQALFYNQQSFLDMFDRLLPIDYLYPLKIIGPGYEILRAYAKVGERVSLAISRMDCGAHILTSFGPALASGYVQFSRPTATAGAFTVKAGTVVTTSVGGRSFVLLQDVGFGATDLGPFSGLVRAIAPGFEWNVPGVFVTAGGETVPGAIDTIKLMIQSPAFTDTSVVVTQHADMTGGQPGMLDQLGADRGLPRAPGEADSAYRARIRQLPDTVSPAALQRALHAFLDPIGVTFDFIETFKTTYQTCYDVSSTETAVDANLFFYDDPRPAYPPFRNRWLDENDFRAAFIVTVPFVGAQLDQGVFYDDTPDTVAQCLTPALSPGGGGTATRAMSFYDVVATTPVTQGFYDGFDLPKQALYLGILNVLEQIKAAGVYVTLELQGQ